MGTFKEEQDGMDAHPPTPPDDASACEDTGVGINIPWLSYWIDLGNDSELCFKASALRAALILQTKAEAV